MTAASEVCYVILPFSKTSAEHTPDYWKSHYENFLKPLIEENTDLEVRRSNGFRADDEKEELGRSVTSRLVVADLTDLSPNVFWELGARNTLGYDSITVAQEGTIIPMAVGSRGTLFYSNDYPRMARFIRDFNETLQYFLERVERTDGLAPEGSYRRTNPQEVFRRQEAIRRLEALISESERNMDVLNFCIQQNLDNRDKTAKYLTVSEPLRTSAIDVLITKRFLDRDHKFYQLAEDCFSGLQTYMETMNSWSSDPDEFEPWLINNGNNLRELLTELIDSLKEVYGEEVRKEFAGDQPTPQ